MPLCLTANTVHVCAGLESSVARAGESLALANPLGLFFGPALARYCVGFSRGESGASPAHGSVRVSMDCGDKGGKTMRCTIALLLTFATAPVTAGVDETDALFMIGACAAFVSYLINKSRGAGLI